MEFPNSRNFLSSASVSPHNTDFRQNISKGISDLKKQYHPDFGYKEELNFKKQTGWSFLLEVISKFPKRERMLNTIQYLNENKHMQMQFLDEKCIISPYCLPNYLTI